MRKTIVFAALIFTIVLCNTGLCAAGSVLPFDGKASYSVASWYGASFHGKQTASGQLFNMYDFTCAHKNYPFGTLLKITNILNDRTIFCVVNDRGPLEAGRDLDLSYAAAKMIGMIASGICLVKVEYMGFYNKYLKR